ncbi:MAG: M48 family metallopeptidase, partial [Candidatus Omnitrophica bacterium]|nr:M48 family metallopeptidase [Candidatus Omnitrophota bacterium]
NKKVKQELNQNESLPAQAEKLNQRYFSGKLNIASIEYVTSQNSRFGCCNYKKKAIRISHRLAQMPDWVKDYVIVHELAHLIEPNHSKSFWDIVSRYKLAERAKGFLIATQQGVLLD